MESTINAILDGWEAESEDSGVFALSDNGFATGSEESQDTVGSSHQINLERSPSPDAVTANDDEQAAPEAATAAGDIEPGSLDGEHSGDSDLVGHLSQTDEWLAEEMSDQHGEPTRKLSGWRGTFGYAARMFGAR